MKERVGEEEEMEISEEEKKRKEKKGKTRWMLSRRLALKVSCSSLG